MTLDRERRRLCRSFSNLTEWRERRVTCQQLIGDIKYTRKNTISLISEETKNSATLSVFKRAVKREIYDSP